MSDRLCVITEHDPTWSHEERDKVFAAMFAAAPAWAASLSGVRAGDIETIESSEEGFKSSLTFTYSAGSEQRVSVAVAREDNDEMVIVMLKKQ